MLGKFTGSLIKFVVSLAENGLQQMVLLKHSTWKRCYKHREGSHFSYLDIMRIIKLLENLEILIDGDGETVKHSKIC